MSDEKKHSSEECLAAAIEEIRSNPNLVRMHCNTITAADNDLLNMTLWPGIFDEKNWFRQSTKRPSRSEIEEAQNAALPTAAVPGGVVGPGILLSSGAASLPAGILGMLGSGGFYGGTDVVIRTYVNELWEDYSRKLEVIVTETQGELNIHVDVAW